MDTQEEKMKIEEEKTEEQQSTKLTEPNTTTTLTTTSSSPSSSPTHEFSFTISVQPSSANKLSSSSPSSFAIDLSPADEIFFHGHLLPLHFLSHFPMSPRRSTTDSFDCSTSATQPIKDVLQDKKPINSKQFSRSNSFRTKRRIKVKSFSLFRPMKWRKPCEVDQGEEDEEETEETAVKKKVRFDAGIILKSYLRMVRPLLFFRGLSSKNCKLQMRPHSFSSSYPNTKAGKEDRYGRSSAPASFQTSTTTTGPLQARDMFPTSVKDGSMDELQSAIEAAIAHCKNSSTTQEGKFKFQC